MNKVMTALLALTALSGCALIGHHGSDKKAKTPVLGERLPVLNYEAGAEVDPALADTPVTLPPQDANADWSQPGGSADKSMGNLALGTSLSPAWTVSIGEGSTKRARLAAAPVVSAGKIYTIDTRATVRAIDAGNGGTIWSKSLKGSGDHDATLFGGGVSINGGMLYATTGTGAVVALDAATGDQKWRVKPGGPLRGAPSVGEGDVFVVSQDNQIYALKADTGKPEWDAAATLEVAGVFGAGAPAVAQGTVVAGFSSGELNAYRYENGRVVWQDVLARTGISTAVSSLSDIDAEPVIDQGRVYAVGQGGRMAALELVTGQRLWELNIAGISTPAIAGEWLFVVTDEAKILCIARGTGKVRWISQLPRWRKAKKKLNPIEWQGPIIAGDRLILASSDGRLTNVAVADGQIQTSADLHGSVFLSPVVAGNTLYILRDDGKLTAWR